MKFDDLGLCEPLLRAIREEGYEHPTPIQQQAIGHVLEGKDLLGCAQTGTGKTAAFALPLLHRLCQGEPKKNNGRRVPRVLVLSPTRELASQIDQSFTAYGRHVDLRNTVIYGGVRQRTQVSALKGGVDIITATPGRLIDLHGQKHVNLGEVQAFVLDEADRMLDMGFIDDIRRIVSKLPKQRQTLLFSATIPDRIRALSNSLLTDPIEVRVAPDTVAAETVDQTVYLVEDKNKPALLAHLLSKRDVSRALIFTRTKQNADRVAMRLQGVDITAEVIHSDKPQRVREKTLEKFKQGQVRILVASDIAARGIDVDDISHVINYDMPEEAEMYVHRIGRTGRAGQEGEALSFCGIQERHTLDSIERLVGSSLPAVSDHPWPSPLPRSKSSRVKQTANRWRRVSRRGRRR